MRKKIFLTLFILCFAYFLGNAKLASSQTFDFKKAYDDYLLGLDIYRKELAEFERARDFYLQTNTLSLKESARIELYDFLNARDKLWSVYLVSLRVKLLTIPDHPGSRKGNILSELTPESNWYTEHLNVYNREKDTLEDLFAKSKVSEDRYFEISEPIIYEALSTISLSKYLDYKIDHENVYTVVKQKVNEQEGARRSLFDRWITDIDIKFQEVTDIEKASEVIREGFQEEDPEDAPTIYKDFIKKLSEARNLFRSINGFLGEILEALK